MVTRYRRMNFRERKHRYIHPAVLAFAVFAAILIWAFPAKAADTKLMVDIMICESGLKHDAVGDDGVSRGIAQFRKETFFEFAAMAKKQGKWKFGKPYWLNPQQQVFLLEWGLDNGYGRRWTCYRKLTEGK